MVTMAFIIVTAVVGFGSEHLSAFVARTEKRDCHLLCLLHLKSAFLSHLVPWLRKTLKSLALQTRWKCLQDLHLFSFLLHQPFNQIYARILEEVLVKQTFPWRGPLDSCSRMDSVQRSTSVWWNPPRFQTYHKIIFCFHHWGKRMLLISF